MNRVLNRYYNPIKFLLRYTRILSKWLVAIPKHYTNIGSYAKKHWILMNIILQMSHFLWLVLIKNIHGMKLLIWFMHVYNLWEKSIMSFYIQQLKKVG